MSTNKIPFERASGKQYFHGSQVFVMVKVIGKLYKFKEYRDFLVIPQEFQSAVKMFCRTQVRGYTEE